MTGRNTRRSGVRPEWDDAHDLEDDAAMSAADIKFCKDTMKVLGRFGNGYMANPFKETVNDAKYQNIPVASRVDIETIKGRLDNGHYNSFNDFKRDFQLIVNNCRSGNSTTTGLEHDKANDLQHFLTLRFAKKNSGLGKKQAEAATPAIAVDATNSTASPLPAPPAVDSQTGPHGIGQGRTATPSAFTNPAHPIKLPDRTSTPRPSRARNNRLGADQGRGSNVRPVDRSFGTNHPDTGLENDDPVFLDSKKAPGHVSALQSARSGKRVASPLNDGARPKQSRQDTKTFDYRDLRLDIAGMVDEETDRVYKGKTNIALTEDALSYLDYMSQKDPERVQKMKREIKNELDEDCRDSGESLLLNHVHAKINKLLTSKGQSIPRRRSAPASMEDMHSEPPFQARVKDESRR